MRTLRLAFVLLVLPFAAAAAQAPQGRIAFEATEHDFGVFEEGEAARHVFTFRNDGAAPLRLTAVRPSCGCTSPEWTREPVAPGETGRITVSYESEGRPGAFQKTINVETDGEPDLVILRIRGEARPRSLADTYRQGNLRLDLDAVELGEVAAGENGHAHFRVQNAGTRPIRFTKSASLPENVHVELPAAPLFAGDVAHLTVVVVTDGLAAGEAFDYTVSLETDDAEQPVKTFHVRGRMAGSDS